MTAALTIPTYVRTANYSPQEGSLVGAFLGAQSADVTDEWTNPAAPVTNAIKTTFASSASPQVYSGAALNGSVGAGKLTPPRNITITTSGTTPANAPATCLVTGTDIDGAVQTETISGINGGAATYVGVKPFVTVTSLSFAAGAGTAANLVVGFGGVIGLTYQARTRAGAVNSSAEIAGGSKVTTGAFVIAATAPPNGSYAPATPPNGSTSYAVTYEAATQ